LTRRRISLGWGKEEEIASLHGFQTDKAVQQRIGQLALDIVKARLRRPLGDDVSGQQRFDAPTHTHRRLGETHLFKGEVLAVPLEAQPFELRRELLLEYLAHPGHPALNGLFVLVG